MNAGHPLKHRALSRTVARALLAGVLAADVAGCATKPKETAAQATMSRQVDAAKMVQFGGDKMKSFLTHSQTEAIKNMLGGVRGIFIAPYISGEAALIGTEQGTGYFMRRHGKDWSDPVFFKLSEYSIGYQGGAKESHMIILMMTDQAVDDFMKGKMALGGSGGFAVGTMGVGASGAGGLKGGLELLIVCSNEGLFLGSGMSTMTPSLANGINDDIYGKNADVIAVLAGTGGKYAPAAEVRDALSKMVVQAWDVPVK